MIELKQRPSTLKSFLVRSFSHIEKKGNYKVFADNYNPFLYYPKSFYNSCNKYCIGDLISVLFSASRQRCEDGLADLLVNIGK